MLQGSRSGESIVGGGHDDSDRGSTSRRHLTARSEPAAGVATNKTCTAAQKRRCTRGAKRAFGKKADASNSRDLRFEKGPLMGGLIYTIS